MTTEPDDAMLWARENAIREAVEHGFSDVATKIQRGLMPAYVLRDAETFRAGHAARDAEVEALRAGVAELEDVIKHALYTHETSGTIAPSSVKMMRAALKGRTDGRD